MKTLKVLKEEILNNKFGYFYVFFGEDYGLRQHYIQEIFKRTGCTQIKSILSIREIFEKEASIGFFKTKTLYVINGEIEFAKKEKKFISEFIKHLNDDMVILTFDPSSNDATFKYLLETELFKSFEEYITPFPCVEDNIALQFVKSEVSLNALSQEKLIYDCKNNYNNILLECDKIKNFAEVKGFSEQAAYDALTQHNQLLHEYEEFHSDLFMNDILQKHYDKLGYWYKLVQSNFIEKFWITTQSMFNDCIMAYLLLLKGTSKSQQDIFELSKACPGKAGFRYGRLKEIETLKIEYSADDLLAMAYELACLDSNVKTGKIEKPKLFDYFICFII